MQNLCKFGYFCVSDVWGFFFHVCSSVCSYVCVNMSLSIFWSLTDIFVQVLEKSACVLMCN